MSAEKLIKLGIESDGKGLDPINRAVKSLSAELNKLNKLVQGINIAGSQNGSKSNSPLLEKVVKEEAALRKLYKTTNDTANTIDRVFNKAAQAQAREVEALTKKLELLNAQSAKQQKFLEVGGQFRSSKLRSKYEQTLHEAGVTDRAIADTEMKRRGLSGGGGGKGIGIGEALGAAGGGAILALAIADGIAKGYSSYVNKPSQFAASANTGLLGTLYQQGQNGDPTLIYEIAKDKRKSLDAISAASRAASYTNMAGGALGVVSGGVSSGQIGNVVDPLFQMTLGGQEAAMSQAQLAIEKNKAAADVKDQGALQDLSSNAYSRINAFRMYGGRNEYMAKISSGLGYQMTEGESAGLQGQLAGLIGSGRGNQVFNSAASATSLLGISHQSAAGILSGIVSGDNGSTSRADEQLVEIFRKAFSAGIADSQLAEKVGTAASNAATNSIMSTGGRAGASDIQSTILSMLANGPQDVGAINLARTVQQNAGAALSATSGSMATIRDLAFNKLRGSDPIAHKIKSVFQLQTLMEEMQNSGLAQTQMDVKMMQETGLDAGGIKHIKQTAPKELLKMVLQLSGKNNSALESGNTQAMLGSLSTGQVQILGKTLGIPANQEALGQYFNMLNGTAPANGDTKNFGADGAALTPELMLSNYASRGKASKLKTENGADMAGHVRDMSMVSDSLMATTQYLSNEALGNPEVAIQALSTAIKQLKTVADDFVNDIGTKLNNSSFHTNASSGGLGGGISGP